MAFRVYAPGTQVIAAGSFGPLNLDAGNVIAGCGASVIDSPFIPGTQLIDVPAGTYTVTSHIEFTGAATTSTELDTGAGTYDFSESYNNGGSGVRVGPGNPLDEVLGPFTLSDVGWVGAFVGVGSGVSGLTVTAASYIEVSCGGVPWTVGRVSWGSRGAWH